MSTKAFKDNKIEKIKEQLKKAKVAVVTEYRGFSVEEITNLRRSLQKEDGDYTVTKNTLAKIAVKGTEYEVLTDCFKGPIALAFGFKDQVSPVKTLFNFINENKKGEVLAAALDGKLLSANETKALSNLPSREEIYAKMLGCVNSPASGIANSMNAVLTKLVRTLDAAKDKLPA
ncbi:MAG: 50S ribosomal protein L10 [Candidatus Gastranaerophilaceae bacterium]